MTESGDCKHIREQSKDAGVQFGQRLASTLAALGLTRTDLAARTGLDPSTIDRICGGTVPRIDTAVAIVKAIHATDPTLGVMLGRDLLNVARPDDSPDADYNADGKEDGDDLVPAAAAIIDAANGILMATLDMLGDGRVENDEAVRVVRMHQSIRQHSFAHEHLTMQENDRWARRRPRKQRMQP